MPKVTINVDAIADSSLGAIGWYASEAIKQYLLSNGIIIISDTHPNPNTSGSRSITFKHPDLSVSFRLTSGNGANITSGSFNVLNALGTFVISNSNTALSLQFRASQADLAIRFSISVAYNEHATFLGLKNYNNLNGLTAYQFGIVKFKWSSVPEHGHYAGNLSNNTHFNNSNANIAWRYIHVNEVEAIPALSTNGAVNSFFATSTDIILPGKIMLFPWYLSFLGISTQSTDAELEGVSIATGFPPDCPNEFTLNGEEYVRAGKLVMKV